MMSLIPRGEAREMDQRRVIDCPLEVQSFAALSTSEEHQLSIQERNVLVYISGFIVRKITKKACDDCQQESRTNLDQCRPVSTCPVWADGMLYVALSRVKKATNIKICIPTSDCAGHGYCDATETTVAGVCFSKHTPLPHGLHLAISPISLAFVYHPHL